MAFDVHQFPEWEMKGGLGAYDAFVITPSDTVDFSQGTVRGIYVGGAGNVTLITPAGTTVLFTALPVGTFMPVLASRVKATGTTATALVGLL
jgi:hypothetical protein